MIELSDRNYDYIHIEDRIREINLKCVHVNELVPILHYNFETYQAFILLKIN